MIFYLKSVNNNRKSGRSSDLSRRGCPTVVPIRVEKEADLAVGRDAVVTSKPIPFGNGGNILSKNYVAMTNRHSG